MLKFIPGSLKRIPEKFNSLQGKIDSFIRDTGGYKVFVYINLAILLLISVLFLLQQKWINKEKKALEDVVEAHSMSTAHNMGKAHNMGVAHNSKELEVPGGPNKGVSLEKAPSKDELLFTIKKKIKEADLYFEFEQYNKAVRIYEKLSSKKIVFNEKDKVVNNLAECYFYLGNFELARENYRKVLNDFLNTPYRLSSQLGEGKCLIQLGEFGEARRVLYLLVAKEAKYDEEDEKSKVVEAYYKIAESYIAQANERKENEQVPYGVLPN